MTGYIYCLKDEAGGIFYIGATARPLNVRLSCHIHDIRTGNSWVYQHMRDNGITPTIHSVENIEFRSTRKLWEAEKKWVIFYRALGIDLKNCSQYHKEVDALKKKRNASL